MCTWVLRAACRGISESGEAALGSGLHPCCLGQLASSFLVVTQFSHVDDRPFLQECLKEHMKRRNGDDRVQSPPSAVRSRGTASRPPLRALCVPLGSLAWHWLRSCSGTQPTSLVLVQKRYPANTC